MVHQDQPRKRPGAAPLGLKFVLITDVDPWYGPRVREFDDDRSLALAVFHTVGYQGSLKGIAAYGPGGRAMNMGELHAFGYRLLTIGEDIGARSRIFPAYMLYVYRCGPVHGVRKYRGGGYGFHRHPRTLAERRGNQVLDRSEEPPVRAARCGYNLPSDRDDLARSVQSSWKEQRRGRKAWER